VCKRLSLWWGISPVFQPMGRTFEENIRAMEEALCARRAVAPDDLVVVTGSQPFEPGVHTNFVKFHRVGCR